MSTKTNTLTTSEAIDWLQLRGQLLLQWGRLQVQELDKAGPNNRQIALLIEMKYGVARELVETYLNNFERTIPQIQ